MPSLDTKLADRTAALQGAPLSEIAKPREEPSSTVDSKDRKVSRGQGPSNSPTRGDAFAKIRQDLGDAQRSRGLMETRLQTVTEQLDKLKLQSTLDSKRIGELIREKTTLITGTRDRDEELRGKAKLLEVGNRI